MAFLPAAPMLKMVVTSLAILVFMFLAGSGASTPAVLGARDNELQAGDGAALTTSSGGELLHQHEVSRRAAQVAAALYTERY
jgi:hypothetical protein